MNYHWVESYNGDRFYCANEDDEIVATIVMLGRLGGPYEFRDRLFVTVAAAKRFVEAMRAGIDKHDAKVDASLSNENGEGT